MALPLASVAIFSGVMVAAGAVTAGGIGFTADTVARIAAAAPVKVQPPRISYGIRLPSAKAEDLNIARSWPVATTPQPSEDRVAEALSPHQQPAKSPPGAFVLENGKWVKIVGSVKGWVRSGDGTWIYADLSDPTAE